MTQNELKELAYYNEDTGIFKRRITTGTYARKGTICGSQRADGYVKITFNYKGFYAHRLAWLYVYGKMPTTIDHIDRNPSNNRIANLREVTRSLNAHNVGVNSTNTSGTKGVYFKKATKKWVARITIEGKIHFLGSHSDIAVAIKLRKDAECKLLNGL